MTRLLDKLVGVLLHRWHAFYEKVDCTLERWKSHLERRLEA